MVVGDSAPTRVAIVEDDADTRLLLRLATDLDPRYELVGEFDTLRDAIRGLVQSPVDVVIVDRLTSTRQCYERLAQLRVAVGRARIVVIDPGEGTPGDLALAAGADALLEQTALTRVADALQLAAGHLEAAA